MWSAGVLTLYAIPVSRSSEVHMALLVVDTVWLILSLSLEPGTLAANYSIGKSTLPNAHAGCALEKVEISAGQIVTGTACFRLGDREKAVHISKNGYLAKLRWISSKYFLFWDEQEKQGWLANGAGTLLHLLRAYLVQSKRDFPSDFLASPHDLPDAIDPTRPEAAMEVLTSLKNRELRLYVEKSNIYDDETTEGPNSTVVPRRHITYYTLGDRVEHIFNCLEKLIAHQVDVQRRSGVNIHIQPRRQLEGWDFRDLVTDRDPFLSRVATLPTIGKGWVDLTRSLNAVTLFGRGFGELIQPKAATMTCPLWSSLPSNKFYLACCIADLMKIMEDGDNLDYADSNPRRLSSSVLWYMKKVHIPARCLSAERTSLGPGPGSFPVDLHLKTEEESTCGTAKKWRGDFWPKRYHALALERHRRPGEGRPFCRPGSHRESSR